MRPVGTAHIRPSRLVGSHGSFAPEGSLTCIPAFRRQARRQKDNHQRPLLRAPARYDLRRRIMRLAGLAPGFCQRGCWRLPQAQWWLDRCCPPRRCSVASARRMAGRSAGRAPLSDTSAITRNATVGVRVMASKTSEGRTAAMTIPKCGLVRGAHLTGSASHARASARDSTRRCHSRAVMSGGSEGT